MSLINLAKADTEFYMLANDFPSRNFYPHQEDKRGNIGLKSLRVLRVGGGCVIIWFKTLQLYFANESILRALYHLLKGFGVILKPERQSFAWNQRRHLFLSPQEAMFETHCKLTFLMTWWMKKPTDQTERSLQRFWPPTYNSCHWMSTRMNWTDHRVEDRRSNTDRLSPLHRFSPQLCQKIFSLQSINKTSSL